ncbi:TRAP transporter large permease [Uliginosibacterium sp. sgz301328]|uniref:TRAP transporter large permease n=1 Tax=Uliginosibacterium sp. sgz301328 TaxID=3243764 RepID=UPI00359E2133
MAIETWTALTLFGIFFALLFVGFPVAFGVALSSIAAMIVYADFDTALNVAGQGLATGVEGTAFLAIPLFVIAGNIMNTGSIAKRLIDFTKIVAAPLPGPLAHCNIIASTLFGALAGIASAAAIAVGGTIFPHAKREKYEPEFMAAVNAAAAPAGLLIPPSGSLILFSLYSGGTSIAALFVAGYLPGMLWGLSCIVPALYFTIKNKYPREKVTSWSYALRATWNALPSLGLIVILIGGIVTGAFTATEAAGMAVFFSFLLSFAYRELKLSEIPRIFIDSVVPSAICLFLVACSGIMGWVLNYASIPEMISQVILDASSNKVILLLLINLMLLVVGTFLDLTPALIIFTPMLMPVFAQLGMHPVHVGIMMVFNLCIGLITPPVGTLLFVSCSIADIPFQRIIPRVLPMVFALIAALALVTFVPEISLFVPRQLGLIQ